MNDLFLEISHFGDAPNSENNAVSYNMGEEDRVEDVPS